MVRGHSIGLGVDRAANDGGAEGHHADIMSGINIIRAQQQLLQKAAQQKGYVHLVGGVWLRPLPPLLAASTAKMLAAGWPLTSNTCDRAMLVRGTQSDQIISNVIPTAMYVVTTGLVLDGMYKMYLGVGKKDGF
jgi:hypothetical protein